jgi:hypothetical protein
LAACTTPQSASRLSAREKIVLIHLFYPASSSLSDVRS